MLAANCPKYEDASASVPVAHSLLICRTFTFCIVLVLLNEFRSDEFSPKKLLKEHVYKNNEKISILLVDVY